MGDFFQSVVDLDATSEDAPVLGQELVAWLVAQSVIEPEVTPCILGEELGHPASTGWHRITEPDASAPEEGVEVVTTRHVFGMGEGDPDEAVCPRCAAPTPIDGALGWAGDALTAWQQTGSATLPCDHCETRTPVEGWRFLESGHDWIALGHLGLVFWGWPLLSSDFVVDIAQRTGGHRVALLHSTL